MSKADGSVGRIFEGHLNAYERLALEDIDPEDHLLGVWGADPTPDEGEPARIENGELHGSKVFCSGAGGLDRALVIAKGTLVYVDLHENVTIDKSWYRAGGMRASESHRVHFHGAPVLATLQPLTTQPYFARDAVRTAACWAGMLDAAVESAAAGAGGKPGEPDDLRALAARQHGHRDRDDRPLVRARRDRRHGLDPAQTSRRDRGRDDPRRGGASDRLTPVRDGHGP